MVGEGRVAGVGLKIKRLSVSQQEKFLNEGNLFSDKVLALFLVMRKKVDIYLL